MADITESIERPIWCIVINQCWCGFVMATVTSTPRLPKEIGGDPNTTALDCSELEDADRHRNGEARGFWWIWWMKWITISPLVRNCPHRSEKMSRGNESSDNSYALRRTTSTRYTRSTNFRPGIKERCADRASSVA